MGISLDALVGQMTLEEKIGQMVQLTPDLFGAESSVITGPLKRLGMQQKDIWLCGSVVGMTKPAEMRAIQARYLEKSRLKIPLIFMHDVIHGMETIFPIPLALACSWNPGCARAMAEVSGKEAAVSGIQVTFSPMADLVRDPRWGRVMEAAGEDGYLGGRMAAAMVQGYQHNREAEYRISACVKHFAAYGAPEGGRDYNTTDMSDWMLREYYLPAYRAALDAGCDMVMTSYSTVHGVPATASAYLNRRILREEWGFEGVLISDWIAVEDLMVHGVAQDNRQAALLAARAGVDIEMMSGNYTGYLKQLVAEGAVSLAEIDAAVYRVLRLKEKRGLFENPYGMANTEKAAAVCLSKEHRATARQVAAQSMVLLKNSGVLPLASNVKIALLGPHAANKNIMGSWRAKGRAEDVVSLYEALAGCLGTKAVLTCEGCDTLNGAPYDMEKARVAAQNADIVVLAVGEDQNMSGEASSYADITLAAPQQALIEEMSALGKPVVVVLFGGRPLDIHEWIGRADAVLEAWFPGTEGGNAIADILLGKVNPSGRLCMSFPYMVGQIPVYYNHFNTGRPLNEGSKGSFYVSRYMDCPNEPLFPFGFGLGYAGFEYGRALLSSAVLRDGSSITASITVKNTGQVAGVETVQLYLQDLCGCVVRPVRELKGFEQVLLQPGQAREVCFTIEPSMLAFHDSEGKRITEAGDYAVHVGRNAADTEKVLFTYVAAGV